MESHIIFLRFYLFIFRERGRREEERERNIDVWLSLSCPQPGTQHVARHVPQSGIEPATLWFTGWHSIHWAMLARAWMLILKNCAKIIDTNWNCLRQWGMWSSSLWMPSYGNYLTCLSSPLASEPFDDGDIFSSNAQHSAW